MVLYHGTDIDGVLDILNNGLNKSHLIQLPSERMTQLGIGWYTTGNFDAAWFFASFAPGNRGRGYTVIEMEISLADLAILIRRGLAIRREIINVPFVAEQ